MEQHDFPENRRKGFLYHTVSAAADLGRCLAAVFKHPAAKPAFACAFGAAVSAVMTSDPKSVSLVSALAPAFFIALAGFIGTAAAGLLLFALTHTDTETYGIFRLAFLAGLIAAVICAVRLSGLL